MINKYKWTKRSFSWEVSRIFQRSEIRRKLEKIQEDQLRSLNTSSGVLDALNNSFNNYYYNI